MKLMSNLKKKQICAAIICGLMFMGGHAEAAVDLYGAYNGDIENVNGAAITDPSDLMDSNIRSEKADFTVTGGEWKNIYGGYGATGYIQNNAVTISGGTVVNNNVYGGFVAGGTATQNTVTITGGTVNGNVIGGWTSTNTASGNNVIIAGGEVKGNVYGGYANTVPSTVSGNTITLGDMNNPDRYAQITRNVYPNAVYMTTFSMDGALFGGTVNVYNTGNTIGGYLSALGTQGSEDEPPILSTINFYINAADMDATGSKIMLNVANEASVGGNTTICAGVRNVGSVKAGDRITLLQAGTFEVKSNTNYKTMSSDGIMKVDLDFKLYKGDSEVPITTTEKLANGKIIAIAKNDGTADLGPDSAAKSPVETMAASVSLINAGADMMAGEAMTGAAQST
ncbi:MAG: hypothetical protein Q4D07_09425, partial [Selenomonadaceae bacterium]|nr:hypothetical protein [Selenomonadaceae bacterium]